MNTGIVICLGIIYFIVLIVAFIEVFPRLKRFFTLRTYKYASKWKPPKYKCHLDPELESFLKDFMDSTPEFQTDEFDLEMIKQTIRDCLDGYDFLAWDRFNTLNIRAMRSDMEHPIAKELIAEGMAGFYDSYLNLVVLMPNCLNSIKDDRIHTVIHEQIHSLFPIDETVFPSSYNEGIVEHMTARVAMKLHVSGLTPYKCNSHVIGWLIQIFGDPEVIECAYHNQIGDLIDMMTRPGMGEKLNAALFEVIQKKNKEDGVKMSFYYNVIYDILMHAVLDWQRQLVKMSAEHETSIAKVFCDTLTLDNKYLDGLLNL